MEPSSDRELRLLSEVEENPEVTQRQLSLRVGIALGLTNVLLHGLVQKGYVRATQAGWKRWLYNLTPKGIAHKIQLTTAYVRRVLDHYQKVRHELRAQLAPLALNEESEVAIYGTGEFAELVYLGLRELGIEEIDIFVSGSPDGSKFLGMPVQNLSALKPDRYDWVVISVLGATEQAWATLRETGTPPEKLVTFFMGGLPKGGA